MYAGGQSAAEAPVPETEDGTERTFIRVAALVDTNVLVYRFDGRFPEKQNPLREIAFLVQEQTKSSRENRFSSS